MHWLAGGTSTPPRTVYLCFLQTAPGNPNLNSAGSALAAADGWRCWIWSGVESWLLKGTCWCPRCPFGYHRSQVLTLERRGRREVKVQEKRSESAWKVSLATFVSLCLITHVILLPVTLLPSCRPAVYSVLVTLSPTLLFVCSLVLGTHVKMWSFRSPNKLIFTQSPHDISSIPPVQFNNYTFTAFIQFILLSSSFSSLCVRWSMAMIEVLWFIPNSNCYFKTQCWVSADQKNAKSERRTSLK